jgi:hypothetical protein
MKPTPVQPPSPPQRNSWIPLAIAAVAASVVLAVLTVLTLGYFGPVLFIGAGIFAIIGLQYLIWGWWFERIYRSGPLDLEEDEPHLP